MEVTKHGYHIMTAKLLDSGECKKIIDFIEDNIDEFKTNKPKKGYNTNSMGRPLSHMSDKKEFKEIDDLIFKAVGKAVDVFMRKDDSVSNAILDNLADSGYELRKVIGPTQLHSDGIEFTLVKRTSVRYRVGTLVISLSGTGDTLEFPHLDISVPLEEGTIVFFPPYWTHIHESKWSGIDTYRIQTWLTNDRDIKKIAI
tara:strand:+ start:321 stop:917 length:597 start_codon:yes stop_codon:yes gene_type:complete